MVLPQQLSWQTGVGSSFFWTLSLAMPYRLPSPIRRAEVISEIPIIETRLGWCSTFPDFVRSWMDAAHSIEAKPFWWVDISACH
jgi:hypothetical protein